MKRGGSKNEVEEMVSSEPSSTTTFPFTLLRAVPRFSHSRTAIRNVSAVPQWGTLLSVTDKYVTVHDLKTLEAKGQLPRTKHCSCFCVHRDAAKKQQLLCAVARRKLVVYVFDGPDVKTFTEYRCYDMKSMSKSVVSVCWADDAICVAFRDKYVLVDVESGVVSREIFDTGYVIGGLRLSDGTSADTYAPCSLRICRQNGDAGHFQCIEGDSTCETGDEIMLTHGRNGIFVRANDAAPTRHVGQCLRFSSCPILVHVHFPFLIAVLSDAVEVHNVCTTALYQRIVLRGVKHVATTVATTEDSSSRRTNVMLLLSTAETVYVANMTPLQDQIDDMMTNASVLSDEIYEEALSLSSLTRRVRSEKVVPAVSSGRCRELHESYANFLFDRGTRFADALMHFECAHTKVCDVLHLFTSNRALICERAMRMVVKNSNDHGGKRADVEDEAVRTLLIPFLIKQRKRHAAVASSTKDDGRVDEESDVRGLIDTTLLMAYVSVDPSMILPFLRSGNYCWMPESRLFLEDNEGNMWEALVELYASNEMHREALELLQQLMRSIEDATKRSVDNVYMVRMTEYLIGLGQRHADLVFEFSRHVLTANHTLGLTIFTDRREGVQALRPRDVLRHLKSCKVATDKHETSSRHKEFVMLYLEHVIDPRRLLLNISLDDVDTLSSSTTTSTGFVSTDAVLHNELVFQYTESVLGAPSSSETYRQRRLRLRHFLRCSHHYDASIVLSMFPAETLLEERAVLLRRLRMHDRALHIFVHKLQSRELAEKYCESVYKEGLSSSSLSDGDLDQDDKQACRRVFDSLIRTYLRPRRGGQDEEDAEASSKNKLDDRDVATALELLRRYNDRINPIDVVKLLPPQTKMNKTLCSYFRSVLRRREHVGHAGLVERSMKRLEGLKSTGMSFTKISFEKRH